jgi:hypothetical protein
LGGYAHPLTIMKSKITRYCLPAVIVTGGAWLAATIYFRQNLGWPLSLLFGAVFMLILIYMGRAAAGKPASFQLVLRLADDKGGDEEDDLTFEALHTRFKQRFPKSGSIRFDGFDTDGSFIWFYFLGPDEMSVRQAVLSHLDGCRIRRGSYFLTNATQPCAPPNDGPATLLGDSSLTEGPSSVS